MAALNFPDNPASQDPTNTFSPSSTPEASTNGVSYLYVNGVWTAQPGDASRNIIVPESTDPPSAASIGNLWFNNDEGRLYIFYQDADGNQWIDASPDTTAPTTVANILDPSVQSGTTDDRYLMLSTANNPLTGNLIIGGAEGVRLNTDGTASFFGAITGPTFTGTAGSCERTILTSNGLTGGGTLTSDVTISADNASIDNKGVVQLINSVASTSQSLAPTANALKTTYDQIANYAPSKNGLDATGTWEISVTGSAALVNSTESSSSNFKPFAFLQDGGTVTIGQKILTTSDASVLGIRPSNGEIRATKFLGDIQAPVVQGDGAKIVFEPESGQEILRIKDQTEAGEIAIEQSGNGLVMLPGVRNNTTSSSGNPPNVHVRPDGRLVRVSGSSLDSVENLKLLISALDARISALEAA
jgi:hypothetical protein